MTNIHTIANIVNGAVIMPGDTFSLNQFVGPRDTKRGFVEAPMIEDGLFHNSVGGGVSQFATTMYNAVFFAGLKDIEHHPHSYYISRYPAGREATVSYPAPNLIFQNDEPTGDRRHHVVHRHVVDGDVLGHEVLRRHVGLECALRPDDDRHASTTRAPTAKRPRVRAAFRSMSPRRSCKTVSW